MMFGQHDKKLHNNMLSVKELADDVEGAKMDGYIVAAYQTLRSKVIKAAPNMSLACFTGTPVGAQLFCMVIRDGRICHRFLPMSQNNIRTGQMNSPSCMAAGPPSYRTPGPIC